MKKFFLSPYPPPDDDGIKSNIRTSGMVSLFIFLFLFLLRPMGLPSGLSIDSTIFIFGFGVITFAVCILYQVIIPTLWEAPFKIEKWTLLKSIVFIACLIFTIAICNIIYIGLYHDTYKLETHHLPAFILGTFVIGVIPSAFFLTLDFIKSRDRFHRQGKELEKELKTATVSDNAITFISNYGELPITLSLADFLFVEAEGNYIVIHSKIARKAMLRNSMKYAQMLFEAEEKVVLTHRSYLVNLDQVAHVSGNAQGFELSFQDYPDIARVSRSKTKMVKSLLA